MTISSKHIVIKTNKSHLISAALGDRISIECNVTNYLKGNTYAIIKKTNQTQRAEQTVPHAPLV